MYSIEACRVCLQKKPGQLLKLTSSVNEDDGVTFLEHLEYCVNEVNWSSDDFPSLLCDDCINDLLNASKFKLRCIETDIRRRQFIKEQSEATVLDFVIKSVEEIKEEPTETNDNHCDIELKIDIEETKVECNETNECVEKQEMKPEEQNKISKCICNICNRTLNKKSLWRHIQTVHASNKKEKRIFTSYIDKDKCFCKVCNRIYAKKSLWQHVQDVHTSEKKYKCNVCSEAFINSTKLNRHRAKHTGKRNCVCYICGKTYLTWASLKWHIARHENKKKYQCDMCGKRFNVRTTMQFHKRNLHTNREHWKYECTQCGKKFYAPSLLDNHMKRHLKLKNYACPLCDKKFVTKSEVTKHRLHHSNVCSNKCEVCGAEYKHKGALNKHLQNIHSIGTVKETIKKYTCDECPKKFSYRTDFERHKNSHSGLKPYSCNECDERFGCELYVKRHLIRKHGISKNCSS